MARESALWSWLSKARLDVKSYQNATLHIQRIENMLGAGTPDVEGFFRRRPCGSNLLSFAGQFWLELKSSTRPARATTPIRFKLRNREEQIEFMRQRWEIGGNAFFLLQVGERHNRILYLAPGNIGAALQSGMTEGALAVECAGTGVFTKTVSRIELLQRVVSCRQHPHRSCYFQA